MSKSSVTHQVINYLEGRNRWLHAGNNNLPAYLSVMLGRGPQVDALNELFQAPPEQLYVEREASRVIKIGLTSWLQQDLREIDEVPEDLQQCWELIGTLLAQLSEVTASCVRLERDNDALLELGIEQERDEQHLESALESEDALVIGVIEVPESHEACEARILELQGDNNRLQSSKEELRRSCDLRVERITTDYQGKIGKLRDKIDKLTPRAHRYDRLEEALRGSGASFKFEDILAAR